MERVLREAEKKGFSAELFYRESNETEVLIEDSRLSSVASGRQCGYALRLRKGDRLGFSYCKGYSGLAGLLPRAESCLKVKSEIVFPQGRGAEDLDSFDPSIETVSVEDVVENLNRVCLAVKKGVGKKGQCDISARFGVGVVSILNTNGLDVVQRSSFYQISPQILFPNGRESLRRLKSGKAYFSFPEEELNGMIVTFLQALPYVEKPKRKMDAVLSPHSVHVLLWRIAEAASAASLLEGTSKLKGKVAERIFSGKLTVLEEPRIRGMPDSRWFDDEGTPTRRLELIQSGVFSSFYSDLEHARRLGMRPTGNGYRTSMWGGDPVSLKPVPALKHLTIVPGDKSLEQILVSAEEAVLVEGVMGAHSGNIPNGDFSVALSPGLLVRKGRIIGRIKGEMFSGNIYDVLKRVEDVEDRLHESEHGRFPHLRLMCAM